jgi:uncharacterized protein YndB with AHSA1/START domain
MRSMASNAAKTRTLVVTRVMNVPVAIAWQAWSDPELLMRWWGPDYFTSPMCKMDFREGGSTHVAMRAPAEMGNVDYYNIWTYTKIVPLQHIEYIQNPADAEGNVADPVAVGMPPDMPVNVRTVVTFRDLGEKTEVTITEYDMPSADTQMGQFAELGLQQTMDKQVKIFTI